MAQKGNDDDKGEPGEQSRARVEFRVKKVGVGDGGSCVLGPTVAVTRERQYRHSFDDGLLYKGEFPASAGGG